MVEMRAISQLYVGCQFQMNTFYMFKAISGIKYCLTNPDITIFGALFDLITLPNKLAYYSFLTRKNTIFVSLFSGKLTKQTKIIVTII